MCWSVSVFFAVMLLGNLVTGSSNNNNNRPGMKEKKVVSYAAKKLEQSPSDVINFILGCESPVPFLSKGTYSTDESEAKRESKSESESESASATCFQAASEDAAVDETEGEQPKLTSSNLNHLSSGACLRNRAPSIRSVTVETVNSSSDDDDDEHDRQLPQSRVIEQESSSKVCPSIGEDEVEKESTCPRGTTPGQHTMALFDAVLQYHIDIKSPSDIVAFGRGLRAKLIKDAESSSSSSSSSQDATDQPINLRKSAMLSQAVSLYFNRVLALTKDLHDKMQKGDEELTPFEAIFLLAQLMRSTDKETGSYPASEIFLFPEMLDSALRQCQLGSVGNFLKAAELCLCLGFEDVARAVLARCVESADGSELQKTPADLAVLAASHGHRKVYELLMQKLCLSAADRELLDALIAAAN